MERLLERRGEGEGGESGQVDKDDSEVRNDYMDSFKVCGVWGGGREGEEEG